MTNIDADGYLGISPGFIPIPPPNSLCPAQVFGEHAARRQCGLTLPVRRPQVPVGIAFYRAEQETCGLEPGGALCETRTERSNRSRKSKKTRIMSR